CPDHLTDVCLRSVLRTFQDFDQRPPLVFPITGCFPAATFSRQQFHPPILLVGFHYIDSLNLSFPAAPLLFHFSVEVFLPVTINSHWSVSISHSPGPTVG